MSGTLTSTVVIHANFIDSDRTVSTTNEYERGPRYGANDNYLTTTTLSLGLALRAIVALIIVAHWSKRETD